jgi:hypothetical protein
VRSPGETTESIAFAVACFYFLPFSAQKSHVKPQDPLTRCEPTTSGWHFSYLPTVTLNTDQKKNRQAPDFSGAIFLKISILATTHML